jgi:hypothetical protein
MKAFNLPTSPPISMVTLMIIALIYHKPNQDRKRNAAIKREREEKEKRKRIIYTAIYTE